MSSVRSDAKREDKDQRSASDIYLGVQKQAKRAGDKAQYDYFATSPLADTLQNLAEDAKQSAAAAGISSDVVAAAYTRVEELMKAQHQSWVAADRPTWDQAAWDAAVTQATQTITDAIGTGTAAKDAFNKKHAEALKDGVNKAYQESLQALERSLMAAADSKIFVDNAIRLQYTADQMWRPITGGYDPEEEELKQGLAVSEGEDALHKKTAKFRELLKGGAHLFTSSKYPGAVYDMSPDGGVTLKATDAKGFQNKDQYKRMFSGFVEAHQIQAEEPLGSITVNFPWLQEKSQTLHVLKKDKENYLKRIQWAYEAAEAHGVVVILHLDTQMHLLTLKMEEPSLTAQVDAVLALQKETEARLKARREFEQTPSEVKEELEAVNKKASMRTALQDKFTEALQQVAPEVVGDAPPAEDAEEKRTAEALGRLKLEDLSASAEPISAEKRLGVIQEQIKTARAELKEYQAACNSGIASAVLVTTKVRAEPESAPKWAGSLQEDLQQMERAVDTVLPDVEKRLAILKRELEEESRRVAAADPADPEKNKVVVAAQTELGSVEDELESVKGDDLRERFHTAVEDLVTVLTPPAPAPGLGA